MKKAIQFGAGNIGRGFIGALLSRSGYELVFADISKTLIPELNSRGKYTVEVVGDDKREEQISPVRGMFSDDPKLVETIAEADIITTAVGPNVLKFIAPVIASGIENKMKKRNDNSLNIIACENMIGGSSSLKMEVISHLSPEAAEFLALRVGFPDSAVDRIVPPMEDTGDVLKVRVEEFSEWIVDEQGFIGEIPSIEGMNLTNNLMSFVERKLFTLNTGHSITAYLGSLKKYKTIDESIADPKILDAVRGAMTESGEVLIRRYGFDRGAHTAYIEKILERFRNTWLHDDVQRVGRQPLRKLSIDDRLIKPLRGTIEYGTSHRNLMAGIAAALSFRSDEDEQAKKLGDLLASQDIKSALMEITSLDDPEIIREIETAYSEIRISVPEPQLRPELDQIHRKLNKLIDVVYARDNNDIDTLEKELALLKVSCGDDSRADILQVGHAFGAEVADISDTTLTLQVTDHPRKIDGLEKMLKGYGILEVIRTGKISMAIGEELTTFKGNTPQVYQTIISG